jgi:bifunctional non-homologous end joining protein LigD
MIAVSHPERVVFPEVGRTKGDVVAYYARVAGRAFAHLEGRPLSIKRYPKGIGEAGFFQKNVPAHYPESIARFAVPRSREATRKHRGRSATGRDETVYPVLTEAEHIPYVANQGAIELHVPAARAADLHRPDRLIFDLDPPAGAVDLVRRAARVVREALRAYGVESAPVATGSKGYHVVARLEPKAGGDAVALAAQKLAAMLVARHPDELTIVFRIANRGPRVFLDWMRNHALATYVVPYSLRARPRATVAAPLGWEELDDVAPDGFTIDDAARLLDRPDTVAALAPADPRAFVARVEAEFEVSGIVLEAFDRFRS